MGKDLSVDLVELVMTDFDMILNTDWLAKYEVMIDCKEKMATIGLEGEKPFVFFGTVRGLCILMTSILRARDLFQGDCIRLLASVVDTN